ncbi:ClpP/crotonase-like domain-containing protein [Dichotomocladium elegans]|nr:ClpP/crotonase-like domain-containing protein [Dichotomocladium elegans]
MCFRDKQPTLRQTDDQPDVLFSERPSGFRKIVLNRPKKLNAVTGDMASSMSSQLLKWEEEDDARLYMITGKESRAFCAGGDIRSKCYSFNDIMAKEGLDAAADKFHMQYRLDHLIGSLKKPYVAIINGVTMGAGVGISINGPFRVATENTLFAMPENTIGLFSDASASFWMPRLDGQLGTYLGLTGTRLRGTDAFYAGIATHYVPADRLSTLEARLEELSATSKKVEMDAINRVIEECSADLDNEDHPQFSLAGKTRRAIDRCFQYNTIEEIRAALQNESECERWAKETLGKLEKASPTSLKISLQLIRTGASLNLADCMRLEYQLGVKALAAGEFARGTYATLVTRTAPEWIPATLEEVDLDLIKKHYFDTPTHLEMQLLSSGGRYLEYPDPVFRLPKSQAIRKAAEELGEKGALEYFEAKYKGKHGIRTIVKEVLESRVL